ncbi:AzlC family ABC transporter permease [Poseidonibacter ostreae]|uniref:Branched-chain amino acid ABC transporter permease n=1 Tax=Poseidonibacter ostreae TaxID=2654171 RepID=A0A6L4WS31_9BACT|nr:AzlC family ABC transporter permease [Poseidonibacter ostreae]KAB7887518.1 branched-chain amino acid ABC transporter permease [Poseidonibacter ostreae]KAB7888423.1 branched-chain amino acid ABC transporter permease [Poseidonibacter ostreae]KAB7889120.1 branched-chain amino acid ABC transporter permease [Poseidonibacter ostreae]MAC84114.1 branched-chain amino acid transporter AzlC [Arcobacter sp.]
MKYKNEIKKAFEVSIPVMMGYGVLGFAFGLLLVSFEYSWYLAPLMSLFIYAGALQFVAINFFNAKAGFVDIAIATWFINIRQSFYGLSLLKRFKKTGKLKPYLIFGLTDETYALLTTIKDDEQLKKRWYYFFLTAFNQSYWFIGSTLGAIVGSNIKFDTAGLEFSLTALFVVLCIEQYKNLQNIVPFIIGAVASLIALFTVPSDKMLIVSILLALLLMFTFRKRVENE